MFVHYSAYLNIKIPTYKYTTHLKFDIYRSKYS